MKLLKGKAYEIEDCIYVYDGEGLIDLKGAYLKNIPEDIKRSKENDKISRYRILLRKAYLRLKGEPFEEPKDKTIVKVYYSDNNIHYGVIKDGIIFTTVNSEIRCKYAAYEKAKVTKEQKKALLEIYNQNEKLDKLRKEMDTIKKKNSAALREKENVCKKARVLTGELITKEFIEKFESYLDPEVKRLMDLYDYRTKEISTFPLASNEIIIVREIEIEKWHNSIMIYEEYDNTFHMSYDDKAYKLQEEYKKKYSKPLPVDWTLSQELEIEGKRTLCLSEGYILKIEEMTEHGAKKLAEKFNESF